MHVSVERMSGAPDVIRIEDELELEQAEEHLSLVEHGVLHQQLAPSWCDLWMCKYE